MKKRILSTLLALAMCLSLLPLSALGAEAGSGVVNGNTSALTGEVKSGSTDLTSSNVAEVSHTGSSNTTTGYPTFKEAYEAAKDGDTIKLLADDVKFLGNSLNNPEITKSITLDLNGKTLTGQHTGYSGAVSNGSVTVSGNAVVEIKNGTIGGDGIRVKGGTLTLNGVTVAGTGYGKGVTVYSNTKLIAKKADINGTLTVQEKATAQVESGTINALVVGSLANVILTGGTFRSISLTDTSPVFADMLPKGYAFQKNTADDTSLLEYSFLLSGTREVEDVKVVLCTNHTMENGWCKYCNTDCTVDHEKCPAEVCPECGLSLPTEYYNVWVCGVQVTSKNYYDILANTANAGKVVYYDTYGILILEGAALEYDGEAAIMAYESLGVLLSGHNTITMKPRTSTGYTQYGIKVQKPEGSADTADRTLAIGGSRMCGLNVIFHDDSDNKRACAYGLYAGDAATTPTVSGNVVIGGVCIVSMNSGNATHMSYGIYAQNGDVTIGDDDGYNTDLAVSAYSSNVTNSTDKDAFSCGIVAEKITTGGTVTIKSGNIVGQSGNATSTGGGNAYSNGIYATNINITGGHITAQKGTASGTATTTGGIYVANNGKLTVNSSSGTIQAADIQTADGSTVELKNGTFYSLSTLDANTKLASYLAANKAFAGKDDTTDTPVDGYKSELTNVKIVDHTHTYDKDTADGKCACGYECQHTAAEGNTNTTGNCSLCGKRLAVARIGDTKYETFNEAYEAAQSGDTITLLGNATYYRGDTTDSNWTKNFTLALNSKTLSFIAQSSGNPTALYSEGDVTITGPGSLAHPIRLTGTLTLNGGVSANGVYVENGSTLKVAGDVTVQGTLYFYGGSCELAVGSAYDTVKCECGTMGDLLANGYAFKDSDGTWYDQYNNSTATEINNVTVTAAPITGVTLNANKESYTYGETVALTATATASTTPTSEVTYQYYVDSNSSLSNTKYNLTADTFNVNNLDTGSHTFYVEVTHNGYKVKSNTVTVNVSKGTLVENENYPTPTGMTDLTYNGDSQKLIAEDTVGFYSETTDTESEGAPQFKFRLGTDGTWSDSIPTATNAGDYTVYWYIDGGTNYNNVGAETSPAGTISVTIAPKPVEPTVTVVDGSIYDGTAKQPNVTVEADNTTLTKDTDYTLSYSSNIHAGTNTASVTVTAVNGSNYTFDSVTKNFSIEKADAPTGVTATETEIVYTQTPYTVDLSKVIMGMPEHAGTVTYSLTDNTDSQISVNGSTLTINKTGAVNGTYTIGVTVSSTNYADVTVQVTVKLVDKTKHNDLSVTMTGWTYGDSAKTPVFTKPTGTTETEIKYVKVFESGTGAPSTTAPTEAGNYKVYVKCETATDIWYGTADFTISQKSIEDATVNIEVLSNLIYNGTSQKPTVNVKDGSTTLVQRTDDATSQPDYAVSVEAKINAGSYTVTITGEGNYTGEVIKEWSIAPKEVILNWTHTDDLTYTGHAQKPTAIATGLVNSDTCTVTVTGEQTNAGETYTAMATGLSNSNYKLPENVTASYSIGQANAPTLTNHTISQCYTIGTEQTVPINLAQYGVPADANVTGVSASGVSKEFDATATQSAPDLAENTVTAKYTICDATKSMVGKSATFSYTIQSQNYKDMTLNIVVTLANKAHKSLDVTMTGWTYGAYDEAENAVVFTAPDGTLETKILYQWQSSTQSGGGTPTTSVPTLPGNYKVFVKCETATEIWNGTATFTISKATVTIEATDKHAYIGASAPDLSTPVSGKDYTVTGLVGEDTLEITIALTCDANMNKTGKYDIIPSVTDEDSRYDFTLVNGTLTVSDWPVIPSTGTTSNKVDTSKNFSDVKPGDYFADAVAWASKQNITGGISATEFGPNASCTRAQLVTFLWRTAGCPEPKTMNSFNDVAANAYYAKAVAWAAENGIVDGYGNGLFGSEDTITREQMAVILYRFAKASGMDTTQGGMAVREYSDFERISTYAVSAMQWAVNAGILQGYDGKLMPQNSCTRAQIVTMLYRLLGE